MPAPSLVYSFFFFLLRVLPATQVLQDVTCHLLALFLAYAPALHHLEGGGASRLLWLTLLLMKDMFLSIVPIFMRARRCCVT